MLLRLIEGVARLALEIAEAKGPPSAPCQEFEAKCGTSLARSTYEVLVRLRCYRDVESCHVPYTTG